ncbi:MAG: siderophore-interacting protein, partial [Solirubrobacteraceae bacterium]|nr:siderophore-interacting protein [Solirubrobacteraceae bacterium]
RPRVAVVERVERLTPSLIRIVFGGDGLDGFEAGAFTDHYVKLQFPPPGAPYAPPFDPEAVKAQVPRELWPRTRTYTVRAWDPDARRLTIDVVHHGDHGIAGPWAAAARPGDRIQLLGPGGAYAPDPRADWHLMVGDPSVLPAIAASLARVPAGVPVHVLVAVGGPEDEVPLESPGDLRVRWLHHGEAGVAADADLLVDALRELDWPAGRVHAFVHGEANAVRAVRRHLLADRGVPREDLSVSGYWKLGRTDEGWREEKPQWNRLVEQDVAGPLSP